MSFYGCIVELIFFLLISLLNMICYIYIYIYIVELILSY